MPLLFETIHSYDVRRRVTALSTIKPLMVYKKVPDPMWVGYCLFKKLKKLDSMRAIYLGRTML
jgi:hypothetical protein